MPKESLRFPGDYNLSKGQVEIITATGEILPVRMGTIIELNIFEDIEVSALTGSMVIVDSSNIITGAPLQGNERLSFKLSTPAEGDKEDLVIDASEETGFPFHIYAITNKSIESETIASYTIHFCSREMLRSARTRVSRAYDGAIHQTAIQILRDKTSLDSTKKFRFEQTRNKEKIVIPNMRPLEAMDLLCSKALSKNTNGAGYYFYETTKGFHFRSYESMLTNQGKLPKQPRLILKYRPKTLPYDNKILEGMQNIDSYEFVQNFDTLSQQAMGTYSSKVITYSIYDKTYNIADYSYHDQFFRHFHADDISDSPGRHFHIGNAPVDHDSRMGGNVPGRIGDKTVSDYHDSKVILQPSIRFLHGDEPGSFTTEEGMSEAIRVSQENQVSNSTKVKIVMPGHSYLQAGDVVEFQLPPLERNKGEKSGYAYDEKYSGRYLVSKIRHRLQAQEYRMILELVKDSVYTPYEKTDSNYSGKERPIKGTTDIYSEDQNFDYFRGY